MYTIFTKKKKKEKKKYYKISVFLIKKLMLQSDPLISLWTLFGRLGVREDTGGPLVWLPPQNLAQLPPTRQQTLGSAAAWVSLI